MNQYPDWMYDASLSDIPKEKLNILCKIHSEIQGKNKKEVMSALIKEIQYCNQKGVTFTPEEIKLSIDAIKRNSSAKEQEKIDQCIKQFHQTNV